MTGPRDDGGVPRTFRKVPEGGPEREALRAEARVLLDAGNPQRAVAEALGISRGSLRRLVELPGGTSPARVNGYAHDLTPTEPNPSTPPEPAELPDSPAGWIDRELSNAAAAVAGRDYPRALAHVDRARGRAAVEGLDVEARITEVLEPLPAPGGSTGPAELARVKPERVTVEVPGLGAVDRRLVIAGAVVLAVVVLGAGALIWSARGEDRPSPVEGVPEAV
jgi:hypothetical protein